MTAEEARIRQFMTDQFLFEFDATVTPRSDLFALGLIDSFGFVELVSFLERQFGVTFSEEDLLGRSLNSLESVVAAVLGKARG